MTKDLIIRKLPIEVVDRIHRAKDARQMTIGEYIAALVRLHDVARARADAGDDSLQGELQALGLQTMHA